MRWVNYLNALQSVRTIHDISQRTLKARTLPLGILKRGLTASIAAANGNGMAKEILPKVKAKLSLDQLAEAQKRATQQFDQINANKQKRRQKECPLLTFPTSVWNA